MPAGIVSSDRLSSGAFGRTRPSRFRGANFQVAIIAARVDEARLATVPLWRSLLSFVGSCSCLSRAYSHFNRGEPSRQRRLAYYRSYDANVSGAVAMGLVLYTLPWCGVKKKVIIAVTRCGFDGPSERAWRPARERPPRHLHVDAMDSTRDGHGHVTSIEMMRACLTGAFIESVGLCTGISVKAPNDYSLNLYFDKVLLFVFIGAELQYYVIASQQQMAFTLVKLSKWKTEHSSKLFLLYGGCGRKVTLVSVYHEPHGTDAVFGRRRRTSLAQVASQVTATALEVVKPAINSGRGRSVIIKGKPKSQTTNKPYHSYALQGHEAHYLICLKYTPHRSIRPGRGSRTWTPFSSKAAFMTAGRRPLHADDTVLSSCANVSKSYLLFHRNESIRRDQ
ncbi:hypothetical protein EVAR_65772_1 [Eumeta japonica]|uniref:Uncharacterized protein n=1 Tax=Eumeta variegata TaxID=151549 RepID=A0A4C2A6F5_EUMVA|nr:hypothetical protein EVAR_65772_1 [Eumeta japonica]